MAHTPGPWSVDWDGEDLWNNHIVCSEGRICFMAHSGTERQDEFDANAQLISAAPDLLEALREIETICTESAGACRKRMGTRVGNALVTARAAIRKATS